MAEADGAYQELVGRRREDPDLLVRYGDFLAGPGGDPEGALAQYAQALIWKPDDTTTRLKMADIHLARGAGPAGEAAVQAAEARVRDARRYTVDPASPQAARRGRARGPAAGDPRPVGSLERARLERVAPDPVVVDVDEAALLRCPGGVVLGR